MKIKIELIDEENGHVRINTDPPIPKIVEIYRATTNPPPALVYAITALSKLMGDSERIAKEQNQSNLILPGGSGMPEFIN